MNHLSPEQISSMVAGIAISEDAHARECAVCAREVERSRNMLRLFGSSVREWTDKLDHSELFIHDAVGASARLSRNPRRTPMAWVLAAAALAVAVAIPTYRDSRERELKAQALRDDQLLDDVNKQLSRRGPLAMDPLMRLMTVPDGGSVSDSTKKLENGGVQ